MPPTSGTRTCRLTAEAERARGFTLLELLVVLLIAGILLGIGIGAVSTGKNALSGAAQLLVTAALTARSRAMLCNAPVTLRLSPGALAVSGGPESLWEKEFPRGVEAVSVNGSPLSGGALSVVFQPLGLVREQVVVLRSDAAELSVYVPATGSPRVLEGRYTLERIRKEYL